MYLLKQPYHTNKSLALTSRGKYTFLVRAESTKPELKREIEKHYNVKVATVNTANYQGKPVKRYTKKRLLEGAKSNRKKAVITLHKGHVIDIYADAT